MAVLGYFQHALCYSSKRSPTNACNSLVLGILMLPTTFYWAVTHVLVILRGQETKHNNSSLREGTLDVKARLLVTDTRNETQLLQGTCYGNATRTHF